MAYVDYEDGLCLSIHRESCPGQNHHAPESPFYHQNLLSEPYSRIPLFPTPEYSLGAQRQPTSNNSSLTTDTYPCRPVSIRGSFLSAFWAALSGVLSLRARERR